MHELSYASSRRCHPSTRNEVLGAAFAPSAEQPSRNARWLAQPKPRAQRAFVTYVSGMDRRRLAEGEGFEPPVRFPVQRFSRPPVSTTHTSLRRSGSPGTSGAPGALRRVRHVRCVWCAGCAHRCVGFASKKWASVRFHSPGAPGAPGAPGVSDAPGVLSTSSLSSPILPCKAAALPE